MQEVIKFMREATVPDGLKRFMGNINTGEEISSETSTFGESLQSSRTNTPLTPVSAGACNDGVSGPGYRPKKVWLNATTSCVFMA